jgi:hypothetical protein
MALLCLGYAGVAVAADSFTIGSNSTVGLTPATMSVLMDNDADVQGYVLAIEWDDARVDVTSVDVSGTVSGIGAELVVGELFPAEQGLTLGVVLDATAPFAGQVIAAGAGTEIATFDAVQVGGPEVADFTANFSFIDGMLNDPPLSNIQVQAGLSVGAGAGLVLNGGSLLVQAPPPVTFIIADASGPSYDCGADALGEIGVPVLMDNTQAVQGYVLAIAIGAGVTGSDIAPSGAAAGAEFSAPAILGGGTGATLGVVLDFLAPFDGQTIAPGAGSEIATLTVTCDAGIFDPDPDGAPVALSFVDGVLDSPPLDNVAVIGGASISPILVDGSVTCEAVTPCVIPPPDLGFFCGGADGFDSPIEGVPGDTVGVCFYYSAGVNVQGFQLAVCFDCELGLGEFSIAGSIAEAVGAEFVNYNTGNCQLVAGILLDALPPFDGQTVPQTTGGDPLLIGCIDVTIPADAPCDTCLDVTFCNGATAGGSVEIENIMVIDFGSFQDIPFTNCCVYVAPIPTFKRGDCNDDDKVDLADSATILGEQFFGLAVDCEDACDANDDGKINLADSVYLLNYLFKFGDEPPAPGPDDDGVDPSDDALDCETAACG